MNPLDLPGPQFLGFYAVLFLAAVLLAVFLRWWLRQPGDEVSPEALMLAPEEVAYLGGGEERVVNSAIASLVQSGALEVSATEPNVHPQGEEPPAGASPLQRAVFAAARSTPGITIAAVRSAVAPQVTPIRKRLQELELIVAEDRVGLARWLPFLLVLCVPLFGTMKIFVGISRNRPVTFLILFCIASALVAGFGFARAILRSRRGDRVLARLKQENAAMEFQAGRRADALAGQDLVLALGLFGMGILAGGPLSRLETALKPPPSTSGWASSCSGGGGCGGGCGGGGCGGCGG
jgi:uncharacterized protein (TIGR04222 family)